MNIKGKEHALALIKGVTWRIFGTLATTVIVFVITGKIELAFGVGAFEIASKIILFYFHERLWDVLKRRWLDTRVAPAVSVAVSKTPKLS